MKDLINALTIADDDYLVGLSNKGILKRSYKDLANTEIAVEYSDNSAEVSVTDEKCTVVFPLGNSKCTCPSRSICRHIITSILWLKNNISSGNSDIKKEETSEGNESPKKKLEKTFIDNLSVYPLKAIQKTMKKQYYTSFVTKAKKGILPEIEETSIISVNFPDENIAVRLLDPLECSSCTCHSKELCKHKAAAILAWQIKNNIVQTENIVLHEENITHLDIDEIHSVAQYTMNFLSNILSDGMVRAADNIVEEAEAIAVMCHNARLADCERFMREIGNRIKGYRQIVKSSATPARK